MGFNYQLACGAEVNTKEAQVVWTDDQLRKVFRSYDSNNDGQLSWDELRAAFKYLGSHCSYFRTGRALSYADENKDGLINLSNVELSDLVSYAHSCGYKVF
ncbi:Parvalbumin [Trema orientale]|uniref:Parvalbumin n=1 Tax=Trema orientale TaxID=63057 RepID=A0A2P5E195_TREOI|nr:Parvalbumin [Trema orientale]